MPENCTSQCHSHTVEMRAGIELTISVPQSNATGENVILILSISTLSRPEISFRVSILTGSECNSHSVNLYSLDAALGQICPTQSHSKESA
eukprot:c27315_g3_i1 orf=66-338(+)